MLGCVVSYLVLDAGVEAAVNVDRLRKALAGQRAIVI